MALEKCGYASVDQSGTTSLIKTGPAGFFGFTVTSSTSGTIVVYDGVSASGSVLYANDALTKGQSVDFGGIGYAAKNGLFVVVGGTASVNVAFT